MSFYIIGYFCLLYFNNFSCDSNLKKIDSFNSNSILVSLLNIIINPTISFAIISISFIQIIYALSFYEKSFERIWTI